MIECPEFRNLLLFLREDLSDDDICGRDKLNKSIMEAWHSYYLILKDELEVRFFHLMSINNIINNMTVRLGANLLHRRCMERFQPPAIFRGHSPLGLP